MKKYLLVALLVVLASQVQYVPIPKKVVGIPFGNPHGQINIQLIYDPMCYDTRDFDVKIIRPLQDQFPDQISFRIVGQAKPWHLTAHKIMQGINLAQDQKGSVVALKCFRYFLDNIPTWENSALSQLTIAQYKEKLASQFQTLTGISKSKFLPELNHTANYDYRARQQFKHTTGDRFSGLNPTIYVNNVKVDDGLNLSLEKWKNLINDLLS